MCGVLPISQDEMPEISRFFGIVVAMHYRDHAPPHFHAVYGDYQAAIEIDSLDFIEGVLPRRALALVVEWAILHRRELRANWNRARLGQPLRPIRPLE
jgi:hypothetical protein